MSRRTQKALGVLILLGTLGVASCQAFIGGNPPQTLPGLPGSSAQG